MSLLAQIFLYVSAVMIIIAVILDKLKVIDSVIEKSGLFRINLIHTPLFLIVIPFFVQWIMGVVLFSFIDKVDAIIPFGLFLLTIIQIFKMLKDSAYFND